MLARRSIVVNEPIGPNHDPLTPITDRVRGMRTLRPLLLITLFVASCGEQSAPTTPTDEPVTEGPSAEEAKAFVAQADKELQEIWTNQSRAGWEMNTNITEATQKAAAEADAAEMAWIAENVPKAADFDTVEGLDDATRRQLDLLKRATSLPAPDDTQKREELATISSELSAMYGEGKFCPEDGECLRLDELEDILATSDDYDELLRAWEGWRTVSPPMKDKYVRFATLGNEGAKGIGYGDLGELWRSGYDMPAGDVPAEMDRLWEQVKPLYEQLHCHTRAKLVEKYGADKVPADGPIPAHLLGNMWAQDWSNLYEDMVPYPAEPGLDVGKSLAEKTPVEMVKMGEAFFTGLGLQELPPTFWERSMFERPDDREVVCHASAWDVEMASEVPDVRIKMCIEPDLENLVTIHHELGHNYYYLYYTDLPTLFQQGANDGFHEAVGDTLVLSMTPGYLQTLGLLDQVSTTDQAVINNQLRVALERASFLPFGLMIDKWRWGVFDGSTPPERYNAAWWELRQQYQGIAPPSPRGEDWFDPGAKYHVPGNTPYSRYFFAHILQFQFHEALCKEAGHEGPLHTCTIAGSEEAGAKLQTMLEMGASKPWPDALEAVTGTRQMDGGAMVRYFEPLMGWLQEQNQDRTCGW